MNKKHIFFTDSAIVSPLGNDTETICRALYDGVSAIKECTRFDVSPFPCIKASFIDSLGRPENDSLVWSMVAPIRQKIISWNCDYLLLATTKGEIDLLEDEVKANPDTSLSEGLPGKLKLSSFLQKMLTFFEIPEGAIVSAACASSSAAIAKSAEMLTACRAEKICVLGIDIVSKFVFSGFSALQALSSANSAKPFDCERDGLILGEACGALLMQKSDSLNSTRVGMLTGWGMASDANHVTGPSRDGSGLVSAINSALKLAGITPEGIGAISAHGTATRYNDAMEMHAFKTVFPSPLPVFSVKGALGHTMGASGILETIISLESLKNKTIPPTVGMTTPDPLAENWVSSEVQELRGSQILKTNSGFGGINSALIISE